MKNHLKTLGILIGSIVGFLILIFALMGCFGWENIFAKISLLTFVLFLLAQGYISIYKRIKKP